MAVCPPYGKFIIKVSKYISKTKILLIGSRIKAVGKRNHLTHVGKILIGSTKFFSCGFAF